MSESKRDLVGELNLCPTREKERKNIKVKMTPRQMLE